MEKKVSLQEQMDAVLMQKIEEFEMVDLESENAKSAAEALAKAAEAAAKIGDSQSKKSEGLFKILTIGGGIIGAAVTGIITALSNQKMNDKQLRYLDYSHEKAYQFERTGETEFVVTSPAAKDALREKPKVVK